MLLTLDTCTAALSCAASNHKAAIQLELAVSLAVFHMNGGTSREARSVLNGVYASAGWQCSHFTDTDYKTVNRRINAAASLYEKVPVGKWVGHLAEMEVIKAICEGLAPYELYTIQDVLRYAAPHKVQAARSAVNPAVDILSGPATNGSNHTGQERIMQEFRRAGDRLRADMRRVSTKHLSLDVPKDVSHEEIMEFAAMLLSLAKDDQKELLTA